MKYPVKCKNVIDVTKPPYCADNTGKVDCTDILCRIMDDILVREVQGVEETYKQLREAAEVPKYIGFESRAEKDYINVIFPEYVPASRIIYFPAGTYLVSDTITYSLRNLKNIFISKPYSELCRGIHMLGESMESVVIRLADHSEGFGPGTKKPVISFNNAEECCRRERTNVAQINTFEDITIDCGKQNEGAVGLRFSACNSGRVQNVTFRAEKGYCGLQTAFGTEGSFVNITAEGFEYGVDLFGSSICVFEDVRLRGDMRAAFKTADGRVVMKHIQASPIPLFAFEEGTVGMYYCEMCDMEPPKETKGNLVYAAEKQDLENQPGILGDALSENTETQLRIPENPWSENAEDYVCVDDFGAVGDGKTDCTAAIQEAFNSGKPIILFGDGHYLVNGEITVPKTVKTIDFMFCDLFVGENLRNTKGGALFKVDEAAEDMLFLENLYTFEQFYGHIRLIEHAAVRDLCLSDLHTQTAAMYFNTVPGSRVYLDNCACTTGTYSQDFILHRDGYEPEFTYVIPFEFHGQYVYGRQVNPERADVELLNDNSEIYLDGFKVEGPGTAVKTVNGGKTVIHVLSAGIGNAHAENALVETVDAQTSIYLGRAGGFGADSLYHIIFEENVKGIKNVITDEALEKVGAYIRRIHVYHC